jgi:ribonuclease Z
MDHDLMAHVIILGSASAIPDQEHENTHFAVVGESGYYLVDCPGSSIVRLHRAGLSPCALQGLILTHFHPDHVSGVPLLLMNLWLLGRTEPLGIYGLSHCVERVERMMSLFDWQEWPDFYDVLFYSLPEEEEFLFFENEEFRFYCSPGCHLIPTIGIRFENRLSGKRLVYSSDTEPCSAIQNLARGADVLIHEATGEGEGHTSAFQAGEIAQRAGARKLILIHYPLEPRITSKLVEQAQGKFAGEVELAEDFNQFPF